MKLVLTAVLLAFSSLSVADCARPQAPELPDGAESDLATMVEGQKSVKGYVAETEAYLACITAESEANTEEFSEEDEANRVAAHNAAVDEMEAVAAKFNEEIREYKASAR